jgi:hypothetical protein
MPELFENPRVYVGPTVVEREHWCHEVSGFPNLKDIMSLPKPADRVTLAYSMHIRIMVTFKAKKPSTT